LLIIRRDTILQLKYSFRGIALVSGLPGPSSGKKNAGVIVMEIGNEMY